jgi:hypothetical protein
MVSGSATRYGAHRHTQPSARSMPMLMYGMVMSAIWLTVLYVLWPLILP